MTDSPPKVRLELLSLDYETARLDAVRSSLPELMAPFDWCSDPYLEADNRRRIRECRRNWSLMREFHFAIVAADSGNFLGEVALDDIDYAKRTANVSYWIRRGFRGRGHATAAVSIVASFAFKELELQRLQIHAAPHNGPSLRVAEKIGARFQETLKDDPHLNGRTAETNRYVLDVRHDPGLKRRFQNDYLQKFQPQEKVI